MGLFEKIFKQKQANVIPDGYFKMLNGYTPVFTDVPGSVYEFELTRAAIHSFAGFCGKMKPEIRGSAYKELEKVLQFKPNPFMDTSKFLYRIATILSVNNNPFIIPLEDERGYITGYYPILPSNCEVVEVRGVPYLRYTFSNGRRAAVEFGRVGILTQFHYADDFFGSDNRALNPTMQLIHTHNQGIVKGVKNSAAIRFIAQIGNVLKPGDIRAARDRFAEENLSSDNESGLMLYDSKFTDVKPIESKPFTVNAAQMKLINENVYQYFGTNEKMLQNRFDENEWNAYYDGKIEPFAIQLSLVMTNMTFTPREIAFGNEIIWSESRLQYASNATKLTMSTSMFDRGLLSPNQVMDMWGLPHIKDGDEHYIRKEYTNTDDLEEVNTGG